jgi:DNA-binding transcriptional ArsR family regulator
MRFLVLQPYCIKGDIVDYVPPAQSTVSQHLKVLRESGLIVGKVLKELQGNIVYTKLILPGFGRR